MKQPIWEVQARGKTFKLHPLTSLIFALNQLFSALEPPEGPFQSCTLVCEPRDICCAIWSLPPLSPAISVCGPNVPIFCSICLIAPGKVDNAIVEVLSSLSLGLLGPSGL